MTTPNLYSLQIRVGKCSIDHHRQSILYAVSIQIQGGKQSSPLSQLRKIQGNDIHFNTTLRLSVQKSVIEDQNQNCILTLFEIQEDRSRNVLGKVEMNITKRIEKGFQFIDFKQCIDPQAKIELSVNYNLFELVMRSQLNFPVIGFMNQQENNEQRLAKSRGNETIISDFIDSNADRDQQDYLKQSKAISNIERMQPTSHIRSYSRLGHSQIRCIREKPDFNQSQPEEIVSHYEKQIQNYQNQLKQKEEWALGMKTLVQELEAQNQLLKELTLDELEESKIQNLQMGVDYISKIVKGKFEAAKLAKSMVQVPQQQPDQEQQERGLTQTKSHKSLPKYKQQQQETGINQALANICGNIDNSVIPNQQIYLTQISHLEQQLQKITCEKNELYDTTEAMFDELTHLKQDKDIYINELKQAEVAQQQLREYVQSLKQDNKKLKDQLLVYEKSKDSESMKKISESNIQLEDRVVELERQLKQSMKAIEEFKNDALSARQDIITKDEEISAYKQRIQELLLNTNNKKQSQNGGSSQKIILGDNSNEKSNAKLELHQMYSNLLENSIQERKKLQKEIQPFLSNIRQNNYKSQRSTSNNLQIRKLQNKVNKLFIDLVKNRESCLKQAIDVEKHKRDITTVFKVLLS